MMTMSSTSSAALFTLRILSPAVVFCSTLSLLPSRPPPPLSPSPITNVVVANRTPRRAPILAFLSLAALTFLFDGLTFVVSAVLYKSWPQNTGIEFNSLLGLAAFSGLAAVGAWKDVHGVDVWLFKRITASIAVALLLDIVQVVLIGLSFQFSFPGNSDRLALLIPLLHLVFPAFRVLLLLPLLVALISPRVVYTPIAGEVGGETSALAPTASTLLLPPGSEALPSTGLSPLSADASKYGTFHSTRSTANTSTPTTRPATPSPSHQKSDEKPEIILDPSWREIGRRIGRLSPYLWPSKSRPLRIVAAACILILLLGRVVNFAVPFTLGEVVHIFEGGSQTSPWPYLFGYVGLRFLQSSGGLAAVREALWAPVMQYSDREMSQLSFDHILNLSFAWHTRRKTGEILRILDRGAAINHTLELILFSIIPTFIDIIVALIVFTVTFEWTLTLVIFIVMFAYVAVSVILTQWRTKIRRQMNERDVVTRGIHTDCLLNYETVKYFGGEAHEGERYRNAIEDYQVLEYQVILSLNLLNLAQNFIITLGLLVGSMIVALRVTKGQSEPYEFVIFITYLGQLYGPLNGLGYIYRSVNQSLVDTERLLELLNEPTEVNDKPNAPDLIVNDGTIEFQNVSFSYDGRTTALNGISFKVPKGSSLALVGESGAGKSTILRLLYRFYDLGEGEGRILIDGQDIKDVTQASLRKAIGVVPQDSVLFNSSISYNIGYGKFGASSEEIEAAAKAAQMHDRITSFPGGYNTKVGERGIRLSGGEKQRVAIARTLLKNPPILLLDEATSALDTSTEKDIQKALQNLVKGRSSLSIAHRLSTISSADIILVLKDGQIVEQGSHKELLARDGLFASMWADQISASDDPVVASGQNNGDKNVLGYVLDEPEAAQLVEAPKDDPVVPEADLIDTSEVPSDIPVVEDVPATTVPAAAEQPILDLTEPETTTVIFPLSPVTDEPEPLSGMEATFPTGDEVPVPAAPLSFPTSDDAATQNIPPFDVVSSPPTAPGVTFDAAVNSPPRTGTPDPDSEPKRKRISSQNFQRLARKISITTRRSSIPHIPGITKRDSSPRVSADGGSVRGEGSTTGESPASSIKDDGDKSKSKKKEKKEKKRKSLI